MPGEGAPGEALQSVPHQSCGLGRVEFRQAVLAQAGIERQGHVPRGVDQRAVQVENGDGHTEFRI